MLCYQVLSNTYVNAEKKFVAEIIKIFGIVKVKDKIDYVLATSYFNVYILTLPPTLMTLKLFVESFSVCDAYCEVRVACK